MRLSSRVFRSWCGLGLFCCDLELSAFGFGALSPI